VETPLLTVEQVASQAAQVPLPPQPAPRLPDLTADAAEILVVQHVKLGVLMVDAVRRTAIVAPQPTSEYDVKGGTLKGL